MGPSRSSLARFGGRLRAGFGGDVAFVGPPLLAAPAGELEPVAPDEAGRPDGPGPQTGAGVVGGPGGGVPAARRAGVAQAELLARRRCQAGHGHTEEAHTG